MHTFADFYGGAGSDERWSGPVVELLDLLSAFADVHCFKVNYYSGTAFAHIGLERCCKEWKVAAERLHTRGSARASIPARQLQVLAAPLWDVMLLMADV